MTPATFRASPSQLATWKLCKRKWFYAKVLKLPEPVHPSAALGTECHAALEAWIEQREYTPQDDRVPDIIAPALRTPFMQELREKGKNEVEIKTQIGGLDLSGRIDCHWFEDGTCYIVDHKTTSASKWAKDEYEAFSDPQTVVYSKWAFDQGAKRVVFTYHYIVTRPPYTAPVYVTVEHTPESLEPFIQAAAELLAEMDATRHLTEHEVERTLEACHAFGGCTFKAYCEKEPFAVTQISSKLNSMFGSAPAPQPTPAATPAPKFEPQPPPQPAASNRPTIYFGCAPANADYVVLENFLEEQGFLRRFSEGNKGQHYLNADFNRGPGIVAVDFAVSVHKGAVTLPPHLVVPTESPVGRFLQVEQRYLTPRALLVGKAPF